MEWDWSYYSIRGGRRVGKIRRESEIAPEIKKISVQPLVQDKKLDDPIEWQQYKYRGSEEGRKRGNRVNGASIGAYARSLMAREWARALQKR